MPDSAGEGMGAIGLRWLVVALAFALTVLLPFASADGDGSAFGLPLDVVLTTMVAPLALVLLSFWYARLAGKADGRGSGA